MNKINFKNRNRRSFKNELQEWESEEFLNELQEWETEEFK
jgi:hypothetical protein